MPCRSRSNWRPRGSRWLTLEDLLNRLESDSLLGTVGARDLPDRQQTMNATVAWSYQLLDPDEQRAFRRFGVLPGLLAHVLSEANGLGDANDRGFAIQRHVGSRPGTVC